MGKGEKEKGQERSKNVESEKEKGRERSQNEKNKFEKVESAKLIQSIPETSKDKLKEVGCSG